MSKEYSALTALKNYFGSQVDPSPETKLSTAQILIDYPDVDKMPYPEMLYIIPESGALNQLALLDEDETMQVTAYLLAKYSSTHKTMVALIEAIFDHFAGVARSMITDPTVGGAFLESHLDSWEFYPAITGLTNSVGIEIKISVRFERVGDILPADDLLPGEYAVPVGG